MNHSRYWHALKVTVLVANKFSSGNFYINGSEKAFVRLFKSGILAKLLTKMSS